MTVQDTIDAAAARGVGGLPEPSRLTHVRVWPAPPHWVAEVGSPPHNETVGDGLFASKEAATAAGLAAVGEARGKVAAVLPDDLAEATREWPEPVVEIWDE